MSAKPHHSPSLAPALIGVLLYSSLSAFGGLNPKKVVLAINCGSEEELNSGDGYALQAVDSRA